MTKRKKSKPVKPISVKQHTEKINYIYAASQSLRAAAGIAVLSFLPWLAPQTTYIEAQTTQTNKPLETIAAEAQTPAQTHGDPSYPWHASFEIAAFARNTTRDSFTDLDKAKKLYDTLIQTGFCNFDDPSNYRKNGTRTAQETFNDRKGTCQEYSNLALALLRAVDINAHAFYEFDQLIKQSEISDHVSVVFEYAGKLVLFDLVKKRFGFASYDPTNAKILSDTQFLAIDYTNKSAYYLNQNQYDLAIEHACRAIELDSHCLAAYVNLSTTYGNQGNFEESIKVCLAGLAALPDNPILLYALGTAYLDKKDATRALIFCQKAADANPKFPAAWYHLGLARSLNQDNKGACDAFAQTLELDPAFDKARTQLRVITNRH